MYHSTYPASWFISNQLTKTPLLFTYGDFSLFTVDHLTTFMPSTQHPVYTTQPFTLDIPNMKRIPVNILMQSMESVNSCRPFTRRKNFNQTALNRHFSKESLIESACGDSGVSSSRSSTPSSVETSGSCESKSVSPVSNSLPHMDSFQPRRNSEHGNGTHSQNFNRRNLYNHRHVPNNRKNTTTGIPFKRFSQIPRDEWHNVSSGIWDHYIKTRQKEDMYLKKMSLRTAVHSLLIQIFPNCGLRVVGSSVNGLGTNNSDVDMCLILSTMEIDQQTDAMNLLRYAQRLLNQCSFVKSTELITAKVPILKFTEKYNNIQVDLNVNNTVGIANTQLLGVYSQLDWRVPPLVLIIKKWAQVCEINNAKEMTLSSYSLVLMIIHYLQCGCEPAVLPCLQKMHPRRYESGDYWKWLVPSGDGISFHSKNAQSLGNLLHGFFDYYTNVFDFSKDVISVRLGCKLPKQVAMNFRSAKNKRGHWKFICIEEPFNRTNTACAVYDQDSFNRIMSALKNTWLHLNDKKDLSAVLMS